MAPGGRGGGGGALQTASSLPPRPRAGGRCRQRGWTARGRCMPAEGLPGPACGQRPPLLRVPRQSPAALSGAETARGERSTAKGSHRVASRVEPSPPERCGGGAGGAGAWRAKQRRAERSMTPQSGRPARATGKKRRGKKGHKTRGWRSCSRRDSNGVACSNAHLSLGGKIED